MSTAPAGFDGQSDAELIAAVRAGTLAAYGTLYERHVGAAYNLARRLGQSTVESDDLVSEAFAKVLDILRSGKGPDSAFRAYLLATLRHTAYAKSRKDRWIYLNEDMTRISGATGAAADALTVQFSDTAVAGLERTLVAKAFARLPERWQAVLWHTEIEQQPPAEVALVLGLSPNGVSALAHRAREGLRQAYLQVHLAETPAQRCRATAERLGAWTRQGLAKRERAQVEAHLDECAQCRALAAELADVNGALRAVVGPMVLGDAAFDYLTSTNGNGKSDAARTSPAGGRETGSRQVVAVAIAGATIAAAVAAALAVSGSSQNIPTAAQPEPAQTLPTPELPLPAIPPGVPLPLPPLGDQAPPVELVPVPEQLPAPGTLPPVSLPPSAQQSSPTTPLAPTTAPTPATPPASTAPPPSTPPAAATPPAPSTPPAAATPPAATTTPPASAPTSAPSPTTSSPGQAPSAPGTSSPSAPAPSTDNPSVPQPPTDSPAAPQPPTTQTPSPQAPATQSPSPEPPSTQAPPTEPPAAQSPSTEPPAPQAPSTPVPASPAPTSPPSGPQAPAPQNPAPATPSTPSAPAPLRPPPAQPPATQAPLPDQLDLEIGTKQTSAPQAVWMEVDLHNDGPTSKPIKVIIDHPARLTPNGLRATCTNSGQRTSCTLNDPLAPDGQLHLRFQLDALPGGTPVTVTATLGSAKATKTAQTPASDPAQPPPVATPTADRQSRPRPGQTGRSRRRVRSLSRGR